MAHPASLDPSAPRRRDALLRSGQLALAAGAPPAAHPPPPRTPMNFVTTADGTQIFYKDWGLDFRLGLIDMQSRRTITGIGADCALTGSRAVWHGSSAKVHNLGLGLRGDF